MSTENAISDTPPTQIEFAERLETAGLIHEMIKTLPTKEKLVLRMHYFERMSLKEIAQYFSLTYGAIYLRHKRALRMLRHPERVNRLKESCPRNIFYTPDPQKKKNLVSKMLTVTKTKTNKTKQHHE